MNLPKSYEIALPTQKIIKPLIPNLMELIKRAEDSPQIKQNWEFDLPHRAKDNGLIRQSKGDTDNKWIWQYHPVLPNSCKNEK